MKVFNKIFSKIRSLDQKYYFVNKWPGTCLVKHWPSESTSSNSRRNICRQISLANIFQSCYRNQYASYPRFKVGFEILRRFLCPFIWLAESPSSGRIILKPFISNRFIYANDDFFLMKPICPDVFITDKDEIILYPKEGKEHRTAYGARKKFKYTCECPQKLLGYVPSLFFHF